MSLSNDSLKLITRTAGKEVAQIVQTSDQLAKAKADAKAAEESFDAKVALMDKKFANQMTQGVEQVALASAISFGIGGAIAYIAHDSIATYFGKGSWPALLTLPAVGVVVIAATPAVFKDKRSDPGGNATARASGYGFGTGLLMVGGYLSYQDYTAAA